MSFELKPDESLRKGIRRIVRKQMEEAMEQLTGPRKGPRDEAVHEAGAGTGLQHDGQPPIIHGQRFPRRRRRRDLMLAVAARLEKNTACVYGTDIDQGESRPVAVQPFYQGGNVRRQPGTAARRIKIAQPAVQGQSPVAVVQPPQHQAHQVRHGRRVEAQGIIGHHALGPAGEQHIHPTDASSTAAKSSTWLNGLSFSLGVSIWFCK
jgi:hypothetical protein